LSLNKLNLSASKEIRTPPLVTHSCSPQEPPHRVHKESAFIKAGQWVPDGLSVQLVPQLHIGNCHGYVLATSDYK
jgi:hypothetical protein